MCVPCCKNLLCEWRVGWICCGCILVFKYTNVTRHWLAYIRRNARRCSCKESGRIIIMDAIIIIWHILYYGQGIPHYSWKLFADLLIDWCMAQAALLYNCPGFINIQNGGPWPLSLFLLIPSGILIWLHLICHSDLIIITLIILADMPLKNHTVLSTVYIHFDSREWRGEWYLGRAICSCWICFLIATSPVLSMVWHTSCWY